MNPGNEPIQVNKMIIRPAVNNEFETIMNFYHMVTDQLQESEYGPGWKKDIYPSREDVREAISNENLFICVDETAGLRDGICLDSGNRVMAAMVLNSEYNEGYEKVKWPTQAEPFEILLIHMLGVDYDFANQGVGNCMVRFAIDLARERQMKAIRLDVLHGNLPAEKLYKKNDFKYVDIVNIYYDDTGWTDYDLYELKL